MAEPITELSREDAEKIMGFKIGDALWNWIVTRNRIKKNIIESGKERNV